MAIKSKEFRVKEGAKVDLGETKTRIEPFYQSKRHYELVLASHVRRLADMQMLLYASQSNALLLIFQAMDAAGKDGVIKHVMSGVNPQGCQVFSFTHPSAEEQSHDFLWRTSRNLPRRGMIGIFNRSYYEEVLIVRVHPEILEAEGIRPLHKTKHIWRERYRSINEFERHLANSGTCIVKFFLHLSYDEQRRRFLQRIDEPEKNWKFSMADVRERGFWPDYMKAYEHCIGATSSKEAPWYIVPADDKENARLIVSQIVLDTIAGLKLTAPKTDENRRAELDEIKRQLVAQESHPVEIDAVEADAVGDIPSEPTAS